MDIASQDDENIDLLQPMFCIPCNQLLYDQPEKIYVVYKRPPQYTPSGIYNFNFFFFFFFFLIILILKSYKNIIHILIIIN